MGATRPFTGKICSFIFGLLFGLITSLSSAVDTRYGLLTGFNIRACACVATLSFGGLMVSFIVKRNGQLREVLFGCARDSHGICGTRGDAMRSTSDECFDRDSPDVHGT